MTRPPGNHTVTPQMAVSDVAGDVQFQRAVFDATGDVFRGGQPKIQHR